MLRKGQMVTLILEDAHLQLEGDESAPDLREAIANLYTGHRCRTFPGTDIRYLFSGSLETNDSIPDTGRAYSRTVITTKYGRSNPTKPSRKTNGTA